MKENNIISCYCSFCRRWTQKEPLLCGITFIWLLCSCWDLSFYNHCWVNQFKCLKVLFSSKSWVCLLNEVYLWDSEALPILAAQKSWCTVIFLVFNVYIPSSFRFYETENLIARDRKLWHLSKSLSLTVILMGPRFNHQHLLQNYETSHWTRSALVASLFTL